MAKQEDRTQLVDEVSVFVMYPKSLACSPSPVELGLEASKEPKNLFVSFIPETCTLTAIIDDENAEIQTQSSFTTAKSTCFHFRTTFASVGEPNI